MKRLFVDPERTSGGVFIAKAIEEGVRIAEPGIFNFHQEVLNSIYRYGRTHKLEIMMRYKLRQRDLFSDMDMGLRMLAKRKLDLRPSKIINKTQIRKLFSAKVQMAQGKNDEDP